MTMKRSWSYCVAAILVTTMLACGCSLNRHGQLPWSSGVASKGSFERELSLARLSERHAKAEEAAGIYKGVIAKDPGNALAHHRLGVMVAKQGQYEEAMKHFDIAAKAGQPSSELLADIGYVFYLAEDFAQSEENLRAAIALNPSNKWAHNNLGLVLGEQGRYEESLAAFRRAGSEAQAWNNLAYLQSQAGRLQEAETNYHHALNLDKSMRPAAEALLQVAAQTGSLGNRLDGHLAKPTEMLAEKPEPEIVSPESSVLVETVPAVEAPIETGFPAQQADIAAFPQIVVQDVDVLPASAIMEPEIQSTISTEINDLTAPQMPIGLDDNFVSGVQVIPTDDTPAAPVAESALTGQEIKADGTRASFRPRQPPAAIPSTHDNGAEPAQSAPAQSEPAPQFEVQTSPSPNPEQNFNLHPAPYSFDINGENRGPVAFSFKD